MKDESRFWDRIARRYYRSPIKDLEAYEHKLDVSRRFFSPNTRVLEFGCGTGGTAVAHAPHVQHVHAIDVSDKMLDYARTRARDMHIENVTFEKAGIETLTAEDASYNVILGLSILHLIENRQAVLEKAFRLLKPGGVFISSTACMGDNLRYLKYVLPVGRVLRVFPTVKVFEQKQLVNELQSCGFNIEYQWRPRESMAAFIVAGKGQLENSRPPTPVNDDRAPAREELDDLVKIASYS